MILAYSAFIAKFPEFSSRDESVVTAAILNTELESSYGGLCEYPELREHAIALHVAHNLTISSPAGFISGQFPLKRVESDNEKLEFTTTPVDPYSLSSTSYGVRLEKLLEDNYSGGFLV